MNKTSWFVLLLKLGGKILPALIKGLKFSKVGWIVASLGIYSYLITWQFALLLVSSIFIHECGHVYALKHYKMKVKGIYMIPFLGGVAMVEDEFKNRYQEIIISLYGSVFGAIISFICILLWAWTDNMFFLASASWVALINIFNLLPINPLDGGRIFKSIVFSISEKMGLVFLGLGILACGYFAYTLNFGIFLFLLLAGLIELIGEWQVIVYQKETIRIKKELDKDKLHKDMTIKLDKCKDNVDKCLLIEEYRKKFNDLDITYNLTIKDGMKTPANKYELMLGSVLYVGIIYVLFTIISYCGAFVSADLAQQIITG